MHTLENSVTVSRNRPNGSASGPASSGNAFVPLQPVPFENINIRGDLACRSLLNFSRLEGKWYRPGEVFSADQHGWPGDWVGRLVLGLSLLARATKREPAYLEEILDRIPANLNPRGFFGPVMPDGMHDEQQMAGHSWFIRGLLEYHDWRRDDRVLPWLDRVLENLVLPARGNYSRYPLDAESRNRSSHWKLSNLRSDHIAHENLSDVGCAFILLDGVTHAYQVLRREPLRELAEEMIARYSQMDLAALKVQTHATLSGLRGILRLHELTGNSTYLDLAIRTFDFYKQEACSAVFSNYNWFGRPYWTEPCAVIDSFMLALSLFRLTGRIQYLEDAQHIYFNAFLPGQRANGGFGSDRCVGAKSVRDPEFLTSVNYESYWCCTMRGGEGLARAIQSHYLTDGQRVVVPSYENSTAEIKLRAGTLTLRQKTGFPATNSVAFEVLAQEGNAPEIACFVPPGVSKTTLHLNDQKILETDSVRLVVWPCVVHAGDRIRLTFDMVPRAVSVFGNHNHSQYHAFSLGPAILGLPRQPKAIVPEKDWYSGETNLCCDAPEPSTMSRSVEFSSNLQGNFTVAGEDQVFSLLCDTRRLSVPGALQQILFTAKGTQTES